MRTEDGDIIHKCLSGDTEAFGLLVDKYKASVYALAYAKLGNFHDAQDITQEVFLKAYQKLRTLKRWDKFLSWLYAITSNMCKDFLRAKARRIDGEYIADQNTGHLERLSLVSHHENEVYQSLHETLSMLPEIHRQVLTLHYLGGMSCLEIGQFVGASPDTIAKRLSRARAKLKKEMLTLMNTSFDEQKLNPAFTLNIVEAVKRTRIHPNPQAPLIPVGFAALSLLVLLCLTVPFNQFPAIGNLVGTPIPSETAVVEMGEIPVADVVLAETAIVSSGDGKTDLARNPQPTNIVFAANAEAEVETAIKPIARLGKGTVHRIAYSPDGKLIVAMGVGGIWLYDAETLTEVGTIAVGGGTIALSPDGQTLALTNRRDPTVDLWDITTRKRVGELRLPPSRSWITALTFTLDGNTLAIGYKTGDIVLWDMSTQQQTALLNTPSNILWTLAFSPDGKLLASGGSNDATVSLWDVPAHTRVGVFEGYTHDTGERLHGISLVAFSPDGKTLASGSLYYDTVRLWDVATPSLIAQLDNNADEEYKGVNSIAFSPDSTILAVAGNDGKIRLWDVQTQKRIGVLNTQVDGVSSIVFHPDGQTLASLNGQGSPRNNPSHRGGDMAVRLWDVKTRKQIAVSRDHIATIESLALSPDDALLASGHHDGVVRLWDMQTQKQLATLEHKAMVLSVAFSPDGTLLASGGKDRARLWQVQKRKQIRTFKHKAIVESVAFSPDGKILASVDYDCIRLWDLRRNLWDPRRNRAIGVLGPEPQHEEPIQFNSMIKSVAFSPDGTLVASGRIDGTLRLWDVQNRQEIFMRKLDQSPVLAVAFNPDGKTVAAGVVHKAIYLWDIAEQELIAKLNTLGTVWTLAFSPDGRFLAVGTGSEIRLWDMQTRTEVITLEGGMGGQITSVTFSHDGKKVVAGSGDGTIRVWDTDKFGGN